MGFYMSAKLSGNGTGACASCHVDGGLLITSRGTSAILTDRSHIFINTDRRYLFHPMNGPMVTLTFLRSFRLVSPFTGAGTSSISQLSTPQWKNCWAARRLSAADMGTYHAFINSAFGSCPTRTRIWTVPFPLPWPAEILWLG